MARGEPSRAPAPPAPSPPLSSIFDRRAMYAAAATSRAPKRALNIHGALSVVSSAPSIVPGTDRALILSPRP